MKRPESKLAAGMLLCVLALAMLANVTLVSCEETGRGAGTGLVDGPGALPAVPGSPGGDGIGGEGAAGPAAGAGFSVTRVSREPTMRVRLLSAVERVTLTSQSGLMLAAYGGGAAVNSGPGVEFRGSIEVRWQGGQWRVGNGTLALPASAAGSGLAISTSNATGDQVVMNGVGYPGRMVLLPRSDIGRGSAFDVMEHVGLETYLPGVVAKEMLSGWPAAAYQVQAVCARTYAIHEMLRVGGRGNFDVEAGERDQAYVGVTSNRAAVDAVRSTRGWILTDRPASAGGDADVLRAYYSSTCGGRMASAADTWPTGPGFEFNTAAPIQARAGGREWACQNAPLFRWSITRDRQELVQRIRSFGERQRAMVRQIKDLWSIEAMGNNADGRPSAFRVVEPGGKWYRLTGEQLRLALNTSVTPGSAVSVTAIPMPDQVSPTVGFGVETSGAEAEQFNGPPAPTGSSARAVSVPNVDRKSRIPSSDLEVMGPRGQQAVTISGRGFGHGVGMCQYCARGFAERGEDWRTMLARFYPGSGVRVAY